MNKLKTYMLRIDPEVWQAFKSACAANGVTMKEAITQLLKLYISGKASGRGRGAGKK